MRAEDWNSCDDPAELLRHAAPFYEAPTGNRFDVQQYGQCHLTHDTQTLRRKLRLLVAALIRTGRRPDHWARQGNATWREWEDGEPTGLEKSGRQHPLRTALTIANEGWGLLTQSRKCELIRCVFGDSVQLGPFSYEDGWRDWNGWAVVKIAKTVYDEQRWGDTPILADALEEAGFANATALGHLRAFCPYCPDADFGETDVGAPQQDAMVKLLGRKCVCGGTKLAVHGRGCWVVDLVLQKRLAVADFPR